MMGHREKLKGGDEWDAFSRYVRSIMHWRPGAVRRIKRRFHKRVRRLWRQRVSDE